MDKDKQQAWMDEIVAILQASNPSLAKDETKCVNGHSKTNNIDKHGHCLTCNKNKAIAAKRRSFGSKSIWF